MEPKEILIKLISREGISPAGILGAVTAYMQDVGKPQEKELAGLIDQLVRNFTLGVKRI